MKVLTVVGGRPQFIKASAVSMILRRKHQEILVHTGQHFDYNMSQQFFDELDIPEPDYNLGISGGTHANMTGRMLIALEEVMLKEKPDWVLVYGDMNSTLAAALAAAKLYIPLCHVEAGLRKRVRNSPEEINRICVDHVSTLLLTSSPSGIENLALENLAGRAHFVGNTMYDAFLKYKGRMKLDEVKLTLLNGGGGVIAPPHEFYYLTCHREANTNDDRVLSEIFKAAEQLDHPTIYPVHPRNKQRALRLADQSPLKKLILVEPVGYVESNCLVNNAIKIITDSGGLQTEAFFAEKKCVTILDFTAWPEIMVDGRNTLSAPIAEEILQKLSIEQHIDKSYQPFGDGHAGEKIVQYIERGVQQE